MKQQRFLLIQSPTDADSAARFSMFVTQEFGSKGWSLVSMVALSGGGALLLGFEKELGA